MRHQALSNEALIKSALSVLENQLSYGAVFDTPGAVKDYCRLQISQNKDETFSCLFLDNQHRLLAFESLFHGTINAAAVYPRVILRRCLELNAAAVIFSHNHPSGVTEPSSDDKAITQRLQTALEYIDVRVLDHIVVSRDGATSFIEIGVAM